MFKYSEFSNQKLITAENKITNNFSDVEILHIKKNSFLSNLSSSIHPACSEKEKLIGEINMKNNESESEGNKKSESDLTLTLNNLVKECSNKCEESNSGNLKIKNDDLNHNVKKNHLVDTSDGKRVKLMEVFNKIMKNEEISDEKIRM